MTGDLYIGLISGTSRDGVDAALVQFEGKRSNLLHAVCLPYQDPLKSDLENLLQAGHAPTAGEKSLLDDFLGRHFARAARLVAEQAGVEMRDICAIGSHGQTVWHDPDGDPPVSIQLGSARVITRVTGVTTVADFRSADIKAGGQGAPLAPLLHREMFCSESENRAVLNLGGIANITFLPAEGQPSGFDCGPANCLMDTWARRHLYQAYDDGGRWAASGEVDEELLASMLSDAYFSRPPPKSTGLEHFNRAWLDERLPANASRPENVQATLAELTARTVADCVQNHDVRTDRLLVCGGGVHNTHIMRRLAGLLPETAVESTGRHGANPDWIEAILFAWLGRERLAGRAMDTRAITGAAQAVLLGDIFPAQE